VVTQIMFRRFDVMTANSPGCSNARVSSKIADATEETLNRGSYRALNRPLDLRGIAATFSIWAFHAHWDKGSGWARSPLSCAHTILVLVGFDGFTRRLTRTIIEFQGIS
jgi:hypothetical protein